MSAYYNEFNPHAAAWLRNLIKLGAIAPGEVDERSITDVRPDDLAGFRQCHFFAGVAGWSLALRLAGIPDDYPIWTGSCPCQPYSAAGKGEGDKDERNLWPEFFRLIAACRPTVVFGEQVASSAVVGKAGGKPAKTNQRAWLDGIFDDLEGAHYTCGAADLPAACVSAPHIRQRLYWVADAGCSERRAERTSNISRTGRGDEASGVDAEGGCLADAHSNGRRIDQPERGSQGGAADRRANSGVESVADSTSGKPGRGELGLLAPDRCVYGAADGEELAICDHWSNFDIIHCRDGKARRVGRGVFPLVDGLPADLGRRFPELRRLLARARSGRTGRLKGYGNAIVPQVAAEFIRAWMECKEAAQ